MTPNNPKRSTCIRHLVSHSNNTSSRTVLSGRHTTIWFTFTIIHLCSLRAYYTTISWFAVGCKMTKQLLTCFLTFITPPRRSARCPCRGPSFVLRTSEDKWIVRGSSDHLPVAKEFAVRRFTILHLCEHFRLHECLHRLPPFFGLAAFVALIGFCLYPAMTLRTPSITGARDL